ncbi:hypothetical protein BDB01DRAFT_786410 [Pilobolus umbonatus]|nr:hypothetical protein BDB01DRAFT_786410 [Pilobolus umbonatus]
MKIPTPFYPRRKPARRLDEDIYKIIMRYTTPETTFTCLLVSKVFNKMAEKILYRHIRLRSASQEALFLRCVSDRHRIPKSGTFIQSITFTTTSLTKDQLRQLFQLCPKLETIYLPRDSVYFRYLLSAKDVPLVRIGCTSNAFTNIDRLDDFYRCNHKYSKGLIYLSILQCEKEFPYQQVKDIHKYISLFPAMISLTIPLWKHAEPFMPALMDDIRQTNIQSYFNRLVSFHNICPTVIPLPKNTYPSIQFQNMKALTLDIIKIDARHIQYLLEVFSNLKRLSILSTTTLGNDLGSDHMLSIMNAMFYTPLKYISFTVQCEHQITTATTLRRYWYRYKDRNSQSTYTNHFKMSVKYIRTNPSCVATIGISHHKPKESIRSAELKILSLYLAHQRPFVPYLHQFGEYLSEVVLEEVFTSPNDFPSIKSESVYHPPHSSNPALLLAYDLTPVVTFCRNAKKVDIQIPGDNMTVDNKEYCFVPSVLHGLVNESITHFTLRGGRFEPSFLKVIDTCFLQLQYLYLSPDDFIEYPEELSMKVHMKSRCLRTVVINQQLISVDDIYVFIRTSKSPIYWVYYCNFTSKFNTFYRVHESVLDRPISKSSFFLDLGIKGLKEFIIRVEKPSLHDYVLTLPCPYQ